MKKKISSTSQSPLVGVDIWEDLVHPSIRLCSRMWLYEQLTYNSFRNYIKLILCFEMCPVRGDLPHPVPLRPYQWLYVSSTNNFPWYCGLKCVMSVETYPTLFLCVLTSGSTWTPIKLILWFEMCPVRGDLPHPVPLRPYQWLYVDSKARDKDTRLYITQVLKYRGDTHLGKWKPVFRIRIRIHMFLGLPDPGPLSEVWIRINHK